MIIGNYIGCLSGNGTATGNLEVFYDFSGGSGNYLFNSIYTSGEQVFNGYAYANKSPGVVVKTGSLPLQSILTGQFGGNDLLRIAKELPFSGFTAILDYEQNFCDSSDYARVLISTRQSGISGFDLGVNQVNRLFLEYPSSVGIRRHTSNYELNNKNSVFLSHSNSQAILGRYNYDREILEYDIFDTNGYVLSDNWHIGGSYTGTTTGLKGNIKNFALFNKDLAAQSSPITCLSCSGIGQSQNISLFPIYGVSGFQFSIEDIYGVTGYQNQLTTVSHPTGGQTYLVYESGLSGRIIQRKQISALAQIIGSGSGINTVSEILYDYSQISNYAQKVVHFAKAIPSGYLTEIYVYNRPQQQFNIQSTDFKLNKGVYDSALLWQNGVLNLENLDYYLNGPLISGVEIQGYDTSDLLYYNLTTGRIIITDYSGLWTRSRILLNSGTSGTDVSGEAYWPPQAQYLPSGSAIFITGVSGHVLTGYDLYMNGKKLVNGYDYSIGESGSYPALIMSGEDLPDFSASVSISGDGNVYGWPYTSPPTGVYDINTPILAFVERQPEIQFNRHVFYNTGSAISIYNLTGFSEEIWVNGIKLCNGHDYEATYLCSPSSGLNSYPNWDRIIYNNDAKYFNIE